MSKRSIGVGLLLCIPYTANSAPRCSPTPLSRQEARGLLKEIPQALAAQKIGGKLSIVSWPAGPNYRGDEFYFYEALSTKSTPTTPLGNGVLGYFGVNKVGAQVVELNLDKPSVDGAELSKAQERLRLRHCLSQELARQHENVSLEK